MVDDEDDDAVTSAMDVVPSHITEVANYDRVSAEQLDPGTDVGGYIIDGELGRGGMGVVYAATHPVIGKRAAIKVLKQSLSKNPTTVERFIQEARSVNQIGHPNIVDIFAFGTLPDGRSYLVMDLLEGESLRMCVRRGSVHVRDAVTVVDEISSALIAAHDKGFVHRDLKPDNVFLVSHPGRTDVKLLDFGLAKLMPTAGAAAFRTATGTQLGTPDYMSPEQLRGDSVDHRTDIYALGVMALEILSGKRPRRLSHGGFEGNQTPRQLLESVPNVPPELTELVTAMLEASPDARPSLVAVRAVIKRVRPSLPSLDELEARLPPTVPDGTFVPITASQVGASPRGAGVDGPSSGIPTPAQRSAGPRGSGSLATTKVGVPPPPKRTGPRDISPVTEARPATESRWWLLLAIVLVLAGAIALIVVVAT